MREMMQSITFAGGAASAAAPALSAMQRAALGSALALGAPDPEAAAAAAEEAAVMQLNAQILEAASEAWKIEGVLDRIREMDPYQAQKEK